MYAATIGEFELLIRLNWLWSKAQREVLLMRLWQIHDAVVNVHGHEVAVTLRPSHSMSVSLYDGVTLHRLAGQLSGWRKAWRRLLFQDGPGDDVQPVGVLDWWCQRWPALLLGGHSTRLSALPGMSHYSPVNFTSMSHYSPANSIRYVKLLTCQFYQVCHTTHLSALPGMAHTFLLRMCLWMWLEGCCALIRIRIEP